jgi:SNF2 family DNA or RNA helicase
MESIFIRYLKRNDLKVQPHQLNGVEWGLKNKTEGHEIIIKNNNKNKNNKSYEKENTKTIYGGIIADEMGLGKTYQMIGILIGKLNTELPILIVLPAVLVNQWNEAIRTTLGHEPLVYHGAGKKKLTLAELNARRIVITTYGMISLPNPYKKRNSNGRKKRTLKRTPNILHECMWAEIVYDEAHYMRNECDVKFGALKLKAQCKWLITGTPIQNRKEDLNSLFDVLGVPASHYKDSNNILQLVRDFILRRTKVEVGMMLPPLNITTVNVRWENKKEKKIALKIHSEFESDTNFEMCVMERMCRARQICVYPALLSMSRCRSSSSSIKNESFNSYIERHEIGINSSSKINAVMGHLNTRAENKKSKLIFCHYRGEIDIIVKRLYEAQPKLIVKYIDGRTKPKERSEILLADNQCDVLILQIQTGCVGLNLQQYNEVYFISPNWNPAVEDQAIARCYRMGQLNPTEVFRFSMVGLSADEAEVEDEGQQSIDQYSAQVQERKREIMDELDRVVEEVKRSRK